MKAIRPALAVMLCLSIGAVVWAADDDKEPDDRAIAKEVFEKAKINLSKAIDVAQAKVPGGKPFYAIAEKDDDQLVFLVYVLAGKNVTAVEVDAVTGKIDEIDEDAKDDIDDLPDVRKALKATKIALPAAIASANAKVKGGKPYEVSLELDESNPVIYVEVLAGDKVMEVTIDAASGKVLEVEEAKDE
jgi:uncharacterized membrane protein YkoI